MAARTNNPLDSAHPNGPPPPVSQKTFTIAGCVTTVYGLEELPASCKDVACLWLLHPRLQRQEGMAPVAAGAITYWNNRLKEGQAKVQKGLIAVSFDQRNHGTREVDSLANQAWREGNPRHAQDMFSIYHGTATDTSILLHYISSYAFPKNDHRITQNLVLGISLGGHAVWHVLLHDPRFDTGVVIIGCPDYTRLMTDRAKKSKRETWHSTQTPGESFLGSEDFPPGLVEAVKMYDPAGVFLSDTDIVSPDGSVRKLTQEDRKRLQPLVEKHLTGKRILNLSGGADKLVPYVISAPFIKFLQQLVDDRTVLEDIVYDGVGHETTPAMVKRAVEFIAESMEDGKTGLSSKM